MTKHFEPGQKVTITLDPEYVKDSPNLYPGTTFEGIYVQYDQIFFGDTPSALAHEVEFIDPRGGKRTGMFFTDEEVSA